MQKLSNQILDLRELEKHSTNLCKDISVGDIYLFQGELGAGKTTFVRLLINNLFVLNNLPNPSSITSPTFPILITYELNSSQIYHYDQNSLDNSLKIILIFLLVSEIISKFIK